MVEVVKLEPNFYRADKDGLREMLADASAEVADDQSSYIKGIVILLDDRVRGYSTQRWISGLKLSEAMALLVYLLHETWAEMAGR